MFAATTNVQHVKYTHLLIMFPYAWLRLPRQRQAGNIADNIGICFALPITTGALTLLAAMDEHDSFKDSQLLGSGLSASCHRGTTHWLPQHTYTCLHARCTNVR